MKFEDVYGDKHKTFLGALKVDLTHAYANRVRKAIVKTMIRDQVEGYESDPAIYEEDPTVYIASTQERLMERLGQGIKTIHLDKGPYVIPGDVGGITYIGIGNPTIRFDGKRVSPDIDVQYVKFNGEDYISDVSVFYRIFRDSSDLAVKLLRETAEQGDAAAQTLLAKCYLNGFGIMQSQAVSAEWLQKAVEQEYAPAQMMYGRSLMAYACGAKKFYPAIFADGIQWIQRAAEQGYTIAQVRLGICCLNGMSCISSSTEDIGLEKIRSEQVKGAQWIQRAAEQGDRDAQTVLGICLMEDSNILLNVMGFTADDLKEWGEIPCIERSNARMADWFRKAAEQDHGTGQALLGCCFLEGLGIEQNTDEGIAWMRKAVEHGYVRALELMKGFDMKLSPPVVNKDTVAAWRKDISEKFLSQFM